MKSTATPRPWKIERRPFLGSDILAIINDMTTREFEETDWDANTTFITEAVNQHDELTALAQEYMDLVNQLSSMDLTAHYNLDFEARRERIVKALGLKE